MCDAKAPCLAPEFEQLFVRFPGSATHKRTTVVYERALGAKEWTLNGKRTLTDPQLKREDLEEFPTVVTVCGTDHIPVRTAKIHTTFREKMLRQMLTGQRVLGNMVLFHCTTCNNRFPTFHPDHMPDFQPECFKNCSVEVYDWHDRPGAETTQHATLHRGQCMRCHKSLEKVAGKSIVDGVATFSA